MSSVQLATLNGQGIATKALEVATQVAGVAYKWNGKTLDGFDCSGYVAWVFGELFPNAKEQYRLNTGGFASSALFTDVSAANRAPGDLIQFAAAESLPAHIGIVLDAQHWIGSQSSTGVAKVKFSNPWWGVRATSYRRLQQLSVAALGQGLRGLTRRA